MQRTRYSLHFAAITCDDAQHDTSRILNNQKKYLTFRSICSDQFSAPCSTWRQHSHYTATPRKEIYKSKWYQQNNISGIIFLLSTNFKAIFSNTHFTTPTSMSLNKQLKPHEGEKKSKQNSTKFSFLNFKKSTVAKKINNQLSIRKKVHNSIGKANINIPALRVGTSHTGRIEHRIPLSA